MKPELIPSRWLMLAGILLAAFNLRTAVTSLTPLLGTLRSVFDFGSGVTGVLGMLPTAAFALFGVVTAGIAHRLGLERTTALAMTLALLGLLLRSWAQDVMLLGLASLIALAGMGIGNVVLPPLVKRYFPERIGVLSAGYIAVLQFGTLAPAFLAVPLAQAFGWRVSLGFWAVPAALALLPWLTLAVRQVSGNSPVSDIATVHPPAGARVWRSPLAWALCAMFGMTSLVTFAMFTWLPRWFVDAGASPLQAGHLLGVYSTVGLVTALCVPLLAARIQQSVWIVLAALLSYALGFTGMLLAPLQLPLLWAAALGLAGATFPLGLVLINLRTRTPAGSAVLSAFVQGVGYSIACLGPLLFGLLHDWTGGWRGSVAFLTLCILVLGWGGWLATQPRALEDEWLQRPGVRNL